MNSMGGQNLTVNLAVVAVVVAVVFVAVVVVQLSEGRHHS